MNYYNEFDLKAAAWLRELIKEGHIPPGHVDTRSIVDVKASDLKGFIQHHFFAGIGGWSLALKLAGWPTTRPVWTMSCPCQPYSSAGEGKGDADPRNLWPHGFRLIREYRPIEILGEQVESAIRHGWLDGISADLESEGYAIGSAVFGAHSVGAPHIRQRLYWVAHDNEEHHAQSRCATGGMERLPRNGNRSHKPGRLSPKASRPTPETSSPCGMADCPSESGAQQFGEQGISTRRGPETKHASERTGPNHWAQYDLLPCTDGKARRIEPGSFPLAHGIPARMGRLRGYGNAIVPQAAQAFIEAYLST